MFEFIQSYKSIGYKISQGCHILREFNMYILANLKLVVSLSAWWFRGTNDDI